MHQSSKAFFEKDSVLIWSAVCSVVLWIINGALNLVSGDFSQVMIRSTVGMLAIIPMLNAVICIECRGDAYIV